MHPRPPGTIDEQAMESGEWKVASGESWKLPPKKGSFGHG
jgi:hypothetical protein